MSDGYTDSEKYQQEIADQYKERVSKFPKEKIIETLKKVDISLDIDTLKEASAGNVNATYLTPEYAIKINQDPKHPRYIANKIIGDNLADSYPVPHIITYDAFQKTSRKLKKKNFVLWKIQLVSRNISINTY